MPTTLCPLWNLCFYALIYQTFNLWFSNPFFTSILMSLLLTESLLLPPLSSLISSPFIPFCPVSPAFLPHPSAHRYLSPTPYSVLTISEIWFYVPASPPPPVFLADWLLQWFSNYTKTSNPLTYFLSNHNSISFSHPASRNLEPTVQWYHSLALPLCLIHLKLHPRFKPVGRLLCLPVSGWVLLEKDHTNWLLPSL